MVVQKHCVESMFILADCINDNFNNAPPPYTYTHALTHGRHHAHADGWVEFWDML